MVRGRAFRDDLAIASEGNLEAGTHVVTTDPLELDAGRKAAAVTWSTFPYYERRFADRGRLFCDSDTGWLIARCDAGPANLLRDVLWLARVLSARGMPQYLLETHLMNLHRALVKVGAWPRARFRPLRTSSRELARLRNAAIPEVTFASLAKRFDTEVEAIPERVERFGAIVVAAVADERNGIARAVSSLEEWACDPSLFGAQWIETVRDTIARARAC